MIDLLILAILNSFFCLGFWNASFYENKEEKGVLWFIDKWTKDTWISKPLCSCMPCMASLHSIYPYWIYMYSTNCLNINAILFYPIYVLVVSGINVIINKIL